MEQRVQLRVKSGQERLDMYQSWRRTVRSSRYIVLERKSIPIVACIAQGLASSAADHQISPTGGLNRNTRENELSVREGDRSREPRIGAIRRRDGDEGTNLVGVVELVVHESGDDGRLAHGLVAQEHQLVLGQRRHHRRHGIRYVTRPAFFFFWLCWRPRSSLVFREGPDACS